MLNHAAVPSTRAPRIKVLKMIEYVKTQVLAVKSLAPGAPAVSSGMINPGDILLTVDGKRVTTSAEATKSILGERGSSISLQMERDGERFVVAMRRGTAAKLS